MTFSDLAATADSAASLTCERLNHAMRLSISSRKRNCAEIEDNQQQHRAAEGAVAVD
jgi:hypothetical protein